MFSLPLSSHPPLSVDKGVLFSTSAQPGWRDARWLGGYAALVVRFTIVYLPHHHPRPLN